MAEQNPIKYSDLIAPDDSIEKLIGQLENVTKVYGELSASVKSQAAGIAASLKTISGATESGRATTRNASQEVDRLTKAYKDLEFAQSDTAKRIADLKQIQKEQNMMNKLTAESNRAVEGSYNALSAQYRLNKMYINNLTKAERENDPAAKKLIEETKQIYEEMNKMQQATGKFSLNVGNYTQSIEAAIGANSKWFKTMQQLGALFEGGFSAGVKSAGTAVAGFGKQLLALLANPIVATIAAITAAFMALAKGISSSEENTMALQRVLAPFQRVLTGVLNILQTTVGYILKFAEGFEDAAFAVSRFLEKIPVLGKYIKSANDSIKENIDLTKAEQQLVIDRRKNTEKQAQLEKNIAKWRKEAEQTNDPAARLQLLKRAEMEQKRISLNNIKMERENVRILEAKARMSQNDKQTNDELTAARVRLTQVETEYYQKTMRLASKKRSIENSMKGGGGGGKSTAAAGKERDLAKDQQAALRAQQDAEVALMEDGYDKERTLAILHYDRKIEDLRAHLDEDITIRKAQIATIEALEQQKWNKLADITDKEMKAAHDAEQKDYETRIKATDALIAAQQKQREKQAKEEEENREKVKEAIQEDVAFALESLSQLMEGYVQAAEAKRQLADEEVDRAQKVLDAEIQARNEGYAYDVMSAQKELDLARRNQQKAIEEQRRAQQAKEVIDTATQVSSLITATANIWSSMSSIPVVGVGLAIASIALMWGSFAASKIMAHQAAGSGTEEYGEGTVELLEGGSHQSGNDIDLGRKKDGTRRRAEGGEYFAVINKRNSRKYRNLIPEVINALNDGTFAEKYMGAYGNTGVNVNVGGTPDLSILQGDVRRIREQGESNSFTDGNGNTVMQYKNLRRLIRK